MTPERAAGHGEDQVTEETPTYGTARYQPVPRSRIVNNVLVGFAAFLLVALLGNNLVSLEVSRLDAQKRLALVSFGSSVQARLDRKLDSTVYLLHGLRAYMVTHHDRLDPADLNAMLKQLYTGSEHVRNFGVAVGYRLTYIYPLKTNEKAIGLDFRSDPDEWAAVKRAITSHKAVLYGPIELVQGGHGLLYYLPIYVDGKYWGLLSTNLNLDSLLSDAFQGMQELDAEFGIRNYSENPRQAFWGTRGLFSLDDTVIKDIEVPGSYWQLALHSRKPPPYGSFRWMFRAVMWILAVFVGWSSFFLMHQRMRLQQLAMNDRLTGLPNRLLAEDRLRLAISRQQRDPALTTALVFIDLDGFKPINDRLGHKAGDAVLRGIAERTRRVIREVDTVGRWGGDEFVAILENINRAYVPVAIDRIRKAVEEPRVYAQESLTVGASIGHALLPDDGRTVRDLVHTADQRMYDEKRRRKGAA